MIWLIKFSHNYETDLLRLYHDIITTIGRGNCDMIDEALIQWPQEKLCIV